MLIRHLFASLHALTLFSLLDFVFCRRQDIIAANDTEMAGRYLERFRFNEAVNMARQKGISFRGFYHTSTWREQWNPVIAEQLRIMDGSRLNNIGNLDSWSTKYWTSLLDVVDELHMTVAGSIGDFEKVSSLVNSLKLKRRNKINMVHSPTMERDKYRDASRKEQIKLRIIGQKNNLTEGEYSTINSLHNYCKDEIKAGRKSYVFYAHNKGACCEKSQHPIAEWREELNAFILEFPSTCIRALLQGYVGCGIEYGEGHYSGNYWWADCDHFAAIHGLWDPINNAYAAELLIYNVSKDLGLRNKFGSVCGYNMFHCGVNHYVGRCPREAYLPQIIETISSRKLPPSITARKNMKEDFVKERCLLAHKIPYSQQKTWKSSDAGDWFS